VRVDTQVPFFGVDTQTPEVWTIFLSAGGLQ